MNFIKKNSFLLILLFFFIATSRSQIFNDVALKINATELYYQGLYPNVDQSLAIYEDYNTNALEKEQAIHPHD